MINKLSKQERETHFSLTEDENKWNAYTNISKDMRRLIKQGWTKIKEEHYPDGTIMSMTFEAPRRAISIGKAVAKKRIISDEDRMRMAERLKASKNQNDNI